MTGKAQVFSFAPVRFVLLFALVLAILVARRPGYVIHPQFFAEDATVFFRDELTRGPFALFLPYNGYLHAVPRLVAMAYTAAPAAFAPAACVVLTLAIQALAFSLVYLSCCRYLIRSDALRAATAVVLAACLDGSEGLIGTCADLQWHLVAGGLILLFLPNSERFPASRLRASAAPLASAILCLTVAMLAIMLPFSIWRSWKRTGRERVIALSCTVALSLQILIFCFTRNAAGAGVPVHEWMRLARAVCVSWFYRVFVIDLAGRDTAAALAQARSPAMVVLVAGAAILAFGWLFFRTMRRDRRSLGIAVYVSAVSIPVVLSGRNILGYFQSFGLYAPRFFEPAGCMLVYLIAFALDRSSRLPGGYAKAFAMLLLFSFAIRGNFQVAPDGDLHWARYAPAVQRWESRHRLHLSNETVRAPVLPSGWTLILPAESNR